jgi:hypothetical protein
VRRPQLAHPEHDQLALGVVELEIERQVCERVTTRRRRRETSPPLTPHVAFLPTGGEGRFS